MTEEIIVTGFRERLPNFPGGIWSIRDNTVFQIYKGYGVFGVVWLAEPKIVVGATRVKDPPFIAFKHDREDNYRPLTIEFHNYIPALRAHGIFVFAGKLYVVATQGDPDALICTNQDRWAYHRVGKVIISDIRFTSGHLQISNSIVWNPFACEHHHHYSDIIADKNHIYLASFSTCDASGRLVSRGAITKFNRDYSFHSILTNDLDSPHSLQAISEKIFVCSSGTSSIHSITKSSDHSNLSLEYGGIRNFLRGLYVTQTHFYIGLNSSADRTNSACFTEPINGILKLDRTSGVATKIKLPRRCENVYSIVGR